MAQDDIEEQRYSAIFVEIEELFKKELTNMGKLETNIMKRIEDASGTEDSKSRRGHASPLTFISNMFENAISIKSARLSAIKDIAGVRKIRADLDMKQDRGEGDEDVFQKVAQKLMGMITEGTYDIPGDDVFPPDVDMDALDEAAEAAAAAAGVEDALVADEETGQRFVVDGTTGEVYLVNSDMQILENRESPDRFTIIKSKSGKVRGAMDTTTGEKLELVEISS